MVEARGAIEVLTEGKWGMSSVAHVGSAEPPCTVILRPSCCYLQSLPEPRQRLNERFSPQTSGGTAMVPAVSNSHAIKVFVTSVTPQLQVLIL